MIRRLKTYFQPAVVTEAAEAAARLLRVTAGLRAYADTCAKFAPFTAENAEAATAYQAARVQFYMDGGQ